MNFLQGRIVLDFVHSEDVSNSASNPSRTNITPKSNICTWTGDNLLRQVVYERLREDKPAAEVRREVPIGKPDGAVGHSANAQSSNDPGSSLHCRYASRPHRRRP